MNKSKLLFIIILSVIILACDFPKKVQEEVKKETFTLYDVGGPKHFIVYLRRKSDGKRFDRIFVSQHCWKWGSIKIGTDIDLDVEYYHWDNQSNISLMNIDSEMNKTIIRKMFCD